MAIECLQQTIPTAPTQRTLSRYAQWETFGLLQREDVDPVQIRHGSENDHHQDRNETRTVAHDWGEGKDDWYPIDSIVGHKDQVEGVREPQFSWNRAALFLPLPG
jgi:hypothetical protein